VNDLNGRKIALLLAMTMISMSLLPYATAWDTDMDGTDDSVDDCIRASGTSSIDRTGCPDRDGDGISDITDGWTTPNPNFQTEFVLTSNNDYLDIDYSPNGEFVVTVEDGAFVRKWNSTTFVNTLSVSLGSNTGTSVAYSPDGNYVVAGMSNDAINIWNASDFISVNGEISVDVGSGDQVNDVEFSPNSEYVAVSIGRSGNGGTNGQTLMINVSTGLADATYNPSNEDRFYDAAFSPDGSMLALGGNGDWFIVNTTSGLQDYSNSGPSASVNGIAWSPDGNYIALCIGYSSGSSRVQLMKVSGNGWTQQWIKTHSTSCYSVDFSPDGGQVVFGFGYYQTSGSTAYVYETDSGLSVDSFDFRPSSGCSGGQNSCGSFSGIAWHPDGIHIASAASRNDEGIYFWYADLDEDNDGYNTTDQGDGLVDAFPTDGTQWDDTDNDGYGDNPAPATQPDACITVWGNSTQDRYGCPDSDGDGYSDEDSGWTIVDGADTFPADGSQWIDTDGDGVGDNNIQGTHYDLTGAQIRINQTGDAFPDDITQWNDTDGDTWGDNFVNVSWVWIRPAEWPGDLVSVANRIDAFPLDRTQWMDTDGDWVGDNELSDRSDGCPTIWGDSEFDRLGCLDSDGDGWSDPDANWQARTDCYGADAFPNDPTQWCDEDNDGYGSNAAGNNADDCPNEAGTSTLGGDVGCSDRDGDGYANKNDPFPDHPDQWADRDGDGYGDNPAPAYKYDDFPDDTSQQRDADGDGYGDNANGFNGDKFPNDAEQWADTDGDGYGDNFIDADEDNISEGVSDVCPLKYGLSTDPVTRGCPDTDLDGFTDPEDAFPNDPFQWADTDGDGYGDNQGVPSGDECPDVFGKSNKNNRHGCPDFDFDGWADVDDAFPEDPEQWMDTDGDGYGDNYFYENTTIEDLDYPGLLLVIREQRGDAFPEIADQWSDMDGDGWGDNSTSFYQPDKFPLHPSQWNDFDGDGYGDEANYDPDGEEGPLPIIASWQPDGCRKEAGTSIGNPALDLDWGCPDSDNDGIQNEKDPCPWDPEISSGAFGQDCGIKSDPSINSDNSGGNPITENIKLLTVMGGSILFLLALIFVAQVSKAAGKKKVVRDRIEERLADDAFAEEEGRRQTWIEHYVNEGDLDKARELGWNGLALPSQVQDAAVPKWKQHEIDKKTEQDAAIPSMMDLDRLL